MYSEEKFNLTRFDASWPSAMKGTMFRHEVYLLANLSYPSETVVKRLNYFWSGKLVSDLVSECGISKQAIYASIRKWEENIQELRAIGVRDDVIKHVYKIRVMPPLFDKLP